MLHFVRLPGRLLLLPSWVHYAFAVTLRDRLGATWDSTYNGWILDARFANQAWDLASRCFGLRALCQDCLQDDCERVGWILETRERRAQELVQEFYGESNRHRRPMPAPSTSIELEIRPSVQQPAPLKESAARALGLDWPAERDDIVRAFRRAALRYHPDVGGSEAQMLEILSAREVLLG